MGILLLEHRREFLRRVQNADGGWGYFPGKQSWLEPTAYAILALHQDPASRGAVENAWSLIQSWQSPEGWWRASETTAGPSWTTALGVTLSTVCGEFGAGFERGVECLLRTAGAESSPLHRVVRWFKPSAVERDLRFRGWPWRPGTSSWVEPTAHTLVALKKAARRYPGNAIRQRIDSGERMLLSVRCKDGGWNYGSPSALGIDLPSYPETTALALVGLQMRTPADALQQAQKRETSGLGRAWLTLGLRINGVAVTAEAAPSDNPDILLASLEALGAAAGNWSLLRAELA